MKENNKRVVLDTSAFIAGLDPLSIQLTQYTVLEVENELTQHSLPWIRFKTAVELKKLRVISPHPNCVEKVRVFSKSIGDLLFLSKADKQVLALALEFKNLGQVPEIISDDYSIQNVANKMGIKFVPLNTFGIRFRFHWKLYCPACYRKYPADYSSKQCRICGTTLKRKPIKKTPLQD